VLRSLRVATSHCSAALTPIEARFYFEAILHLLMLTAGRAGCSTLRTTCTQPKTLTHPHPKSLLISTQTTPPGSNPTPRRAPKTHLLLGAHHQGAAGGRRGTTESHTAHLRVLHGQCHLEK
jgi:hypothetical protein